MGYYRGVAGDYYGAAGGLGSVLKGIAKKAVPALAKYGKFLPGPLGAVGRVAALAAPFIKTGAKIAAGGAALTAGTVLAQRALTPAPAMPGGAMLMPSGMSDYSPAARALGFGRKRRSVNVTNVKALRRALGRVEGFKKLAKRVGACPPRRAAGRSSCGKGCAKC